MLAATCVVQESRVRTSWRRLIASRSRQWPRRGHCLRAAVRGLWRNSWRGRAGVSRAFCGFGVGARAPATKLLLSRERTACSSRTAVRGPWGAPGEAWLEAGGRHVGLELTRRARGSTRLLPSLEKPVSSAPGRARPRQTGMAAQVIFRAGILAKKRTSACSSNSSRASKRRRSAVPLERCKASVCCILRSQSFPTSCGACASSFRRQQPFAIWLRLASDGPRAPRGASTALPQPQPSFRPTPRRPRTARSPNQT